MKAHIFFWGGDFIGFINNILYDHFVRNNVVNLSLIYAFTMS